MRRRTRRSLVNIAFFASALFLIIYLNRDPSNSKTFAWTTIRYKTTSTTLPKTHGTCPGLAGSSKPALVVARVAGDGDSNWLEALTDLYHVCIYTADAPVDPLSTHLQVPANRGHEAMAYLTFLIDNYANIPVAGAGFVHGARWAWHNDALDYDNAALLAALNVSAALALSGYHNLRCDWSASMCSPSGAPPQGSLETSVNAMLEPWNARVVSDAALPGALAALFGGDGSGLPKGGGRLLLGRTDAVRAQCCAQFVVARDRVWQHSRDEYVALRQWLLDGSSDSGVNEHSQSGNAAPRDDRVAGRILSYLWHILFMQQGESNAQNSSPGAYDGIDLERLNTLACPRADDCYCRLYGRCHLEGCDSPGRCHGQYLLPPDFRLPDDWTVTHS
ncbi:MAG: hypothetical protein ALECFALPRED_009588 [Alectoria fallacina]|uniref:Uncharacterized protein n=1 Tax=Alectoria fallacina TaxID=1903189 RepID=A0A8H3F1T1_9LECA|nr:MAG: hypothetical protein ALECFALPRED_009588 [Alectoria fallacina]